MAKDNSRRAEISRNRTLCGTRGFVLRLADSRISFCEAHPRAGDPLAPQDCRRNAPPLALALKPTSITRKLRKLRQLAVDLLKSRPQRSPIP